MLTPGAQSRSHDLSGYRNKSPYPHVDWLHCKACAAFLSHRTELIAMWEIQIHRGHREECFCQFLCPESPYSDKVIRPSTLDRYEDHMRQLSQPSDWLQPVRPFS